MLAYLILKREQSHTSGHLIDLFWPQRDRILSRGLMRHALEDIETAFKGRGIDPAAFLIQDGDTVQFRGGASAEIDIDTFNHATTGLTDGQLDEESAANLSAAAALYRGDLLPREDGEWCRRAREDYRNRFLQAVERLIDHAIRHHQWSRAILYGTRYLAREPLAEPIHAALMACFHAVGNRAAAIRQFGHMSKLLRGVLNKDPSDEPVTLYQEILNATTRKTSPQDAAPTRVATPPRPISMTGLQPAVPAGLSGTCVWNKS